MSELSETTERITTPEELAELAVGTNVWDKDGRRYTVDLWRNHPGHEQDTDDWRVMVAPGLLAGLMAFMSCREWVSLTPVAPPEPTPEERIATRAMQLRAEFLQPYHTEDDAFRAVTEAARMIAELEAKLAESVPADHVEYAADHKRTGLDVVNDEDGELFTDREEFMATYETYMGVTLLQRKVGPWETIESRGEPA